MHHYLRKQPVNPLFARLYVLFRKPKLEKTPMISQSCGGIFNFYKNLFWTSLADNKSLNVIFSKFYIQ